MKKQIIKVATIGLLATSSLSAAAFDNHQIDLGVSTLGAGIEYSTSFNKMFAVRTGLHGYKFSMSSTEEDIDYDVDLKLQNYSLLVDYYPFEGSFRLSAGAIYNKNSLSGTGKLNSNNSYEINDTLYTANEVGSLDAAVDFNKIAPYVGMGFNSGNTKSSGFAFTTEVGAMFQGSPKAKLNVNYGSGLTDAEKARIDSDVRAEEAQLNSDISSFKVYPVLAFGIGYKF